MLFSLRRSIQRDFQSLKDRFPTIHLSREGEAELKETLREISILMKSRVKNIRAKLQLLSDEQELLLNKVIHVPNRTYL